MSRYWVGVVSKEHVMVGKEGGFVQLNHGKKNALMRMKKGDKLVFYSPKVSLHQTIPYQKIVAIATMVDDEIYSYEMSEGFVPYRRNAHFENVKAEVELSWLNQFEEWVDVRSKLRYGFFEISSDLYECIYEYMVRK